MNYQKIHDSIIQKARFENRVRQNRSHAKYIYYEEHHIIPRCLNGDDFKRNLVLLTAKEHFLIHKLLVEIYPNKYELIAAFWMMSNRTSSSNDRTYKVSIREYDRLKSLLSKSLSNRNKGKKRSIESVLKQMETNKTKYPNKENYKGNLDKKQSKETIEKRVESSKGKKRTKEFCSKLSNSRRGEGNPMYGKKPWNSGVKCREATKEKQRKSWSQRPLKTCLYCVVQGRGGGMKRYHFDNCKLNPRNQITIEYLIKERVDG